LTDATPRTADPPRGVTGPIGPELLRLAIPIFFSFLLRTAYQWVDALWVRGLGVEATAAVTTSVFVMWLVISLHDVFGLGVSAYVSQLLGTGDRRRAGGRLVSIADGPVAVLLVQPRLERREIVEYGRGVHLTFPGQSFESLRPRPALAHGQHAGQLFSGGPVAVNRAAM